MIIDVYFNIITKFLKIILINLIKINKIRLHIHLTNLLTQNTCHYVKDI